MGDASPAKTRAGGAAPTPSTEWNRGSPGRFAPQRRRRRRARWPELREPPHSLPRGRIHSRWWRTIQGAGTFRDDLPARSSSDRRAPDGLRRGILADPPGRGRPSPRPGASNAAEIHRLAPRRTLPERAGGSEERAGGRAEHGDGRSRRSRGSRGGSDRFTPPSERGGAVKRTPPKRPHRHEHPIRNAEGDRSHHAEPGSVTWIIRCPRP